MQMPACAGMGGELGGYGWIDVWVEGRAVGEPPLRGMGEGLLSVRDFCATTRPIFRTAQITPIPSKDSGQAQSSPVKGEEVRGKR